MDWYDDTIFASAGNDHKIVVLGVDARIPMYTFKGHTDDVTKIAWSPDHSRHASDTSGSATATPTPTPTRVLASASDDGTVKIWKLPNDPELRGAGTGTGRGTPAAMSTSGKSQSPSKEDKERADRDKLHGDEGWHEGIPGREEYLLNTLVVVDEGVENKRMNCLAWSPGAGMREGERMIVAA